MDPLFICSGHGYLLRAGAPININNQRKRLVIGILINIREDFKSLTSTHFERKFELNQCVPKAFLEKP